MKREDDVAPEDVDGNAAILKTSRLSVDMMKMMTEKIAREMRERLMNADHKTKEDKDLDQE